MSSTLVSHELTGVQETMLWSLHERACEVARRDRIFCDTDCVRIYESINYDFTGHFGKTTRIGAARAAKIDDVLRRWLARHPYGFVVSLGEGLETQASRVDNGKMKWLTVDLPDAIEMREHFIRPTERFRHLAMSAFDPAWMDDVETRFGTFIVAQGVLMYFRPEMVRQLLVAISKRFPGAEMTFDLIPKQLSEATKRGNKVTPAWTSPVMPWGLDRNEVKKTLRSWLPGLKTAKSSRYRVPTGRPAIIEDMLDAVVPRRQRQPSLAHLRF